MVFNHRFGFFLGLLVFLLHPADAFSKPPGILVTIKPVHSLAAALLQGVETPQLLIDQLQSPHDYHLKPSDIRMLQQADVIIYAGPQIETFMGKISQRLKDKKLIAFSQIPGVTLHPGRALDGQYHQDHDHLHQGMDGHVWLSTANAKVFVRQLMKILVEMDPENAARYRHNAEVLQKRLDQLHRRIKNQLDDLRDRPFIQFHDALQYFEKEFELSGGYFFTTGVEHKVGIRQLRTIREHIRQQAIRCVFYEPPIKPAILDNLVLDQKTKVLPLEPIGIDLPPGADLYFSLMDNIARQLAVCLKH